MIADFIEEMVSPKNGDAQLIDMVDKLIQGCVNIAWFSPRETQQHSAGHR